MKGRLEQEIEQLGMLRAKITAQLRSSFEQRGLDVAGYADDALSHALLVEAHNAVPSQDLYARAYVRLQQNRSA